MNITNQRIVLFLTITLTAQILLGCATISTNNPDLAQTPAVIESPGPDNAIIVQATIDYGQSQLLDLSRRSTDVSLNMSQAANAAALSTQNSNQRQKMDLAYQQTVVSLNIAQAVATQNAIQQQTNMVGDVTAAAQSTSVAATHSADMVNVARAAQAQAIVNGHILQTDQAAAARTAYPLTATPMAVIQAALLMQEYDREQRSFVNQIVFPLIPVFIILDMLLFILVLGLVYRRYMRRPQAHLLPTEILDIHPHPLIIIDERVNNLGPQFRQLPPYGIMPVNPPGIPDENGVHVEIVEATEPPVAHWIAEVEQQLSMDGGISL
jgi:hypothetical protein